ncbi:hypothetical protein TNCV_4650201 [Trichonephila clavipes]|nr:hypothetical protein TNCV_4650201 [Trichonephila clavipes]
MGACKCTVPSRQVGTLNKYRTASPLVMLVKLEERWETPDYPQTGVSLKIGEGEQSKIVLSLVWCSKLRLTTSTNNLPLSRDEFRGPWSDVTVDQVV